VVALCRGAVQAPESKLLTKLTPVSDAQPIYADNINNRGDLSASASDRSKNFS